MKTNNFKEGQPKMTINLMALSQPLRTNNQALKQPKDRPFMILIATYLPIYFSID